MILFISDIKLTDSRSSTKLLRPLIEELKLHEYVLLSPNTITNHSENTFGFPVPFYKSTNYPLRLLSEVLLPLSALVCYFWFRKKYSAPVSKIVAYSPSIFNVFFVIFFRILFFRRRIEAFLILRDIFPDWAEHATVIRNKFALKLLYRIAGLQYRTFDVVGVQDSAAIKHIQANYSVKSSLVVLPNWYEKNDPEEADTSDFKWSSEFSKHEINLTYTGNVGPAQGLGPLLKLITKTNSGGLTGLAVHIFGGGQEYEILSNEYSKKGKTGIYFWGSVPTEECNLALARSSGAVFTLNNDLTVNNIPGKYMQYTCLGLPIFASVNSGNPVIQQINATHSGVAGHYKSNAELIRHFCLFVQKVRTNEFNSSKAIYEQNFTFKSAAVELIEWLNKK